MEDSGMQVGLKVLGKRRLVLRCTVLLFSLLSMSCAYSASKPILVLGDSLSAEYGLPRGTGWVALLRERLAAEKIDLPIINASISGDTTGGGLARLAPLLQQQPSVVIIELGANDGLRGSSLTAAESNLRTMINAAQAVHAKVLLIGMRLPPNYEPEYTTKFAARYGKLAKDAKTALVPFLFSGLEDKPQLFQADHLHPTVQAQPILLNNVWPSLKPLIAKHN
jgi:acyl-CoA thioesterase-1